MEEPYIPFYIPYGMSDEEYNYEVELAERRHAEWIAQQEEHVCKICGKNLGDSKALYFHIDEEHNH